MPRQDAIGYDKSDRHSGKDHFSGGDMKQEAYTFARNKIETDYFSLTYYSRLGWGAVAQMLFALHLLRRR